jgi:hypothetical protein
MSMENPASIKGGQLFFHSSNPKIGYLLTFKKLSTNVYKVSIFNYNGVEVVDMCPKHPKALDMIVDKE